jgi:DNA-binding FrmR family transcriptional regulator
MTSTLEATEPPLTAMQAQRPEIVMRLHKATGQLAGATRMVEDRR